jgi:hypothetical protein
LCRCASCQLCCLIVSAGVVPYELYGCVQCTGELCTGPGVFTLDIRPGGSWREAEHFIEMTAPELVQVRVSSAV